MSTDLHDIDAYILTGGRAIRMGTAKGSLVLGGDSLVGRVAAALLPVARSVFTVGGTEQFPGIEHISDRDDIMSENEDGKRSSLLGLSTALQHARTEWIFVVACDMPFVKPELFELIAKRRADGLDAVVPVAANGIPQPLCSLYRVSGCMAAAEHKLAAGQRSLQRLLENVSTRLIPFEDIRPLAGSQRFFDNLNTPEDLSMARELP